MANGSGVATPSDFTANAIAGSYIVAVSSGPADAGYALTNACIATTSTLVSVPPAVGVGQNLTLTATVIDDQSAAVTGGVVNFSVGGTPICSGVALSGSGTAQCVTSFATAGNVTVRADFVQTVTHAASFDEESVAVSRFTPTVTAAVSPTTALPGNPITLQATVAGSGATPTGSVTSCSMARPSAP